MAFFKFRQRDDEAKTPGSPVESVEVLRKRAKHRLIGTVILVLAGVIGFPLLVDKQPRPIAVDIAIEIPDKNKVKPLALPSVAPQTAPTPTPVTTPAAPAISGIAREAVLPATPSVAVPPVAPKPETKVEARVPEKTSEKVPDKPPVKTAEKPATESAPSTANAARAQALLDGKEPPSASSATEDRLVVQVGAFADAAKAREARLKLERAGLKTYTQEVQTKDGPRIRVRVGPFGSRADADKTAEKIKKLDLPASILTL